MEKNYALTLADSPKAVKKGRKPLTRYTKQLIKVGKYIKDSASLAFEVTQATLDHWVTTYKSWVENGNKVAIPLGHASADDPEKNAGWVTDMFVKGDALYGVMELLDAKLALTTDVSIYVPSSFTDGTGHKYTQPITHVALCTHPVIPGLSDFEQLSLSLSGDTDMDTKKFAKLLGLPDDADEKAIMEAIPEGITKAVGNAAKAVGNAVKELSQAVTPASDLLVKLAAENRNNKIASLITAGLISPAIQKVIAEKYTTAEPLALTLANGSDDGFDFLVHILQENKIVPLKEQSGQQLLLELTNTRSQGEENPISRDIEKRIKAVGNTVGNTEQI